MDAVLREIAHLEYSADLKVPEILVKARAWEIALRMNYLVETKTSGKWTSEKVLAKAQAELDKEGEEKKCST